MAAVSESNQLSGALNEFSWELYRNLGAESGTNVFFSPYSIMAALAMTFAGAKNDTERQMSDVLRLSEVKNVHQSFQKLNEALLEGNKLYTLRSANRLYAQKDYSFLQDFFKVTEQNYKASIVPVDFKTSAEEARLAINKWVEDQTEGKIQDLIASGVVDQLTVLVLVNAIYFKGNWLSQFEPRRTSVGEFKVSPGENIQVDMMFKKDHFQFLEDRDRKCQVLELPYVGDNLRMTIALPDHSISLADLEAKVNVKVVASWVKALRKQKINLRLPRFKLETSFILNDQLSQMGMPDLFDGGKADLSALSSSSDLYMSKVIHKAFVEVNEEGTEAAAATAAVISKRSIELIPSFEADRPFLFFISDHASGAILFMGRLVRPPQRNQKDEL